MDQNNLSNTPAGQIQNPVGKDLYIEEKKWGNNRLKLSKKDGIFVLVILPLAYLFVQLLLFRWFLGWGVTLFTVLYITAILVYAKLSGIKPRRESWFWFFVLWVTGTTFSIWPGGTLWPLKALFLFCIALYWCATLFGGLIEKKTGNWFIFDALTAFIVPFENLDAFFSGIAQLFRKKEKGEPGEKKIAPILVGVLLTIPLLVILIPMLLSADGGYFSSLFGAFGRMLEWFFSGHLVVIIIKIVLAVLTAIFLAGLIIGYAKRENKNRLNTGEIEKELSGFRFIPKATANTVLILVCILYGIFILCQVSYFFSAFSGRLPEGYSQYSAYAREGFFELCKIAVVNLLVFIALSLFGRQDKKMGVSKVLNTILSVMTVLLIVTALSKMFLYIDEYGLTQKRVLTSVFMVFLLILFAGIIVLQNKKFSIVRLAAMVASVILCLLFAFDLDFFVLFNNTNRYLKGELKEFDIVVLQRAGITGLNFGKQVYESGKLSQTERSELREVLLQIREMEDTFDYATDWTLSEYLNRNGELV